MLKNEAAIPAVSQGLDLRLGHVERKTQLRAAIESERTFLAEIQLSAGLVIDTSQSSIYELLRELNEEVTITLDKKDMPSSLLEHINKNKDELIEESASDSGEDSESDSGEESGTLLAT